MYRPSNSSSTVPNSTMRISSDAQTCSTRPFPALPTELFIHVLDQLTSGRRLAFKSEDPVTKTLHALMLVSRGVYLVAWRYLYSRCVYIDSPERCDRFQRTLGINVGHYDKYSLTMSRIQEAVRDDQCFSDAEISECITSACFFMSVSLPSIIGFFVTIGANLKRMMLDVGVPSNFQNRLLLLGLTQLEEFTTNRYVAMNLSRPPNVKRLAILPQPVWYPSNRPNLYFPTKSLETLVVQRGQLSSSDIERMFSEYKGTSLDVVLVDLNSNHLTPEGTRDWKSDDTVRIWEADVPTSFYGDEGSHSLRKNWMKKHSIDGTLWTQKHRRMASWSEVRRRLDGPVHSVVNVSLE